MKQIALLFVAFITSFAMQATVTADTKNNPSDDSSTKPGVICTKTWTETGKGVAFHKQEGKEIVEVELTFNKTDSDSTTITVSKLKDSSGKSIPIASSTVMTPRDIELKWGQPQITAGPDGSDYNALVKVDNDDEFDYIQILLWYHDYPSTWTKTGKGKAYHLGTGEEDEIVDVELTFTKTDSDSTTITVSKLTDASGKSIPIASSDVMRGLDFALETKQRAFAYLDYIAFVYLDNDNGIDIIICLWYRDDDEDK